MLQNRVRSLSCKGLEGFLWTFCQMFTSTMRTCRTHFPGLIFQSQGHTQRSKVICYIIVFALYLPKALKDFYGQMFTSTMRTCRTHFPGIISQGQGQSQKSKVTVRSQWSNASNLKDFLSWVLLLMKQLFCLDFFRFQKQNYKF